MSFITKTKVAVVGISTLITVGIIAVRYFKSSYYTIDGINTDKLFAVHCGSCRLCSNSDFAFNRGVARWTQSVP
jgi:hypothetical protein